jgi:hypothetical protein
MIYIRMMPTRFFWQCAAVKTLETCWTWILRFLPKLKIEAWIRGTTNKSTHQVETSHFFTRAFEFLEFQEQWRWLADFETRVVCFFVVAAARMTCKIWHTWQESWENRFDVGKVGQKKFRQTFKRLSHQGDLIGNFLAHWVTLLCTYLVYFL